MLKEDTIKVQGKITEAIPGSRFRVELETGQIVMAYLSGKMRKHYVKIMPGDFVTVELSVYDITKGRITYWLKHEAA
jgi:translation initiation factor IF-1